MAALRLSSRPEAAARRARASTHAGLLHLLVPTDDSMMPDCESEVRLSERSRLHVWLSCLEKPGESEVRGQDGLGSPGGMVPAHPLLVHHSISGSLLSALPHSGLTHSVTDANPSTDGRRDGVLWVGELQHARASSFPLCNQPLLSTCLGPLSGLGPFCPHSP